MNLLRRLPLIGALFGFAAAPYPVVDRRRERNISRGSEFKAPRFACGSYGGMQPANTQPFSGWWTHSQSDDARYAAKDAAFRRRVARSQRPNPSAYSVRNADRI